MFVNAVSGTGTTTVNCYITKKFNDVLENSTIRLGIIWTAAFLICEYTCNSIYY